LITFQAAWTPAALAAALLAAGTSVPALADPAGWTVGTCYTRAQLAAEASAPGVDYSAGLAPEISPGVDLDTKDDDAESPFYDQSLKWKIARFAQMMSPGGFEALSAEHAKESGETTEEARAAMLTQRQMIWSDLRTAGIRIKVGALFRDKASGHAAKLLSDAVPDTGEPTQFCIVQTQ